MKVVLFLLLSGSVVASSLNESALAVAKAVGTNVYFSCIVNPPSNPDQQGYCAGLYATYVLKEQILNAPLPLVPSKDPSPYAWSPYDICRFEVGHLIFGNKLVLPYCPSI
jgi:hypothetical protein